MLRVVTLALACGALAGGCASTESQGPPHPEKLYRTGSNIPKREGTIPDGVETSTVGTGDTRLGPPGMPMPMPGGR
jgi:hypothetical protein